jgi:hypothetical protein
MSEHISSPKLGYFILSKDVGVMNFVNSETIMIADPIISLEVERNVNTEVIVSIGVCNLSTGTQYQPSFVVLDPNGKQFDIEGKFVSKVAESSVWQC